MTKILHLINGEHYSGAERVQDLLGQYLSDYGYEPGFACLKPGEFVERRKCSNTPLHRVPMNFRGDFSPIIELIRIIRVNDYRLLHTHTPRSGLIGSLTSHFAQIPLVHHVHSPTSHCTERMWRNRIVAISERVCLSRASKIVSVCESLEKRLRTRGFAAERIRTVPNGVPSKTSLQIKNTPKNEWIVGTAALFRPRKGVEVLLRALQKLKQRGIRFKFHAVGAFETGTYETSVKNSAARLGLDDRIEWKGFTDDIDDELSSMDIFVLPSLYGEGLPMVILEAMAAGLPVIATRVEGVSEVIEHGVTGVLVDHADPSLLANSIQSLITGSMDWGAIREKAHLLQGKQYSARSMAHRVAQVYDEVLT